MNEEEDKEPNKGGRNITRECTCKQIGGKHQCSCPVFNRLAVQRHRAKQAAMKGRADMKCPRCDGKGTVYILEGREYCWRCQGNGTLPEDDPAALLKRIEELEEKVTKLIETVMG